VKNVKEGERAIQIPCLLHSKKRSPEKDLLQKEEKKNGSPGSSEGKRILKEGKKRNAQSPKGEHKKSPPFPITEGGGRLEEGEEYGTIVLGRKRRPAA